MRTNSLISPEEAAGYAMAITEEMAVAQDKQSEALAYEAVIARWPAGQDAAPGTTLALTGNPKAWISDLVAQYWRGGRATA
jgi:hypothetical protein